MMLVGFAEGDRVRWALLDGFYGTVIEVVVPRFENAYYRVRWDAHQPGNDVTTCSEDLLRPVLNP